MLTFKYKANIEYSNKELLISELKFNDFKALVKTLFSNDNVLITDAFETILKNLVQEKELNLLEKIICLLVLRSLCISDIIELTSECPISKKDFNITLNLNLILKNFQKFLTENIDKFQKEIVYSENFKILLCVPNDLTLQFKHNTLYKFIKTVTLNNIEYKNLESEYIEKLPANVLKDIKDFITELEKTCNSFIFVELISPYTTLTSTQISFSILQNSIIDFLKIIFKRNLMEIYELETVLLSKVNLSSSILSSSTFAENLVYLNIFKKNLEESSKPTTNAQLNTINPE